MADGTSYQIPFDHELVVDLFAGGGGASTGIARAYREPDVAVNHDKIAIAVHRANHRGTEHYVRDVFEVDPLTATRGRPVGLLWASPDCRHHSKAKGGAPRSKRIRGLAWVVVRWALACAPRMIEIENVEEFVKWGPLDAKGNPIKARAGETFNAFIAAMTTGLAADHPAMAEIVEFLGPDAPVAALVRGLGYRHDRREIRACTKGAPTIRKRLVMKFRRDGKPITWSADTHGKPGSAEVDAGRLLPYRTAADCIDWSIPGKSIFGRKKPLAQNTCRRIAKGLWRYVLDCPRPFIVPLRGTSAAHHSAHGIDAPLSTVTGGGTHHALVAAHITAFGQNAIGHDLREPTDTVLAGAPRYGLVTAFLEQAAGGPNSNGSRPRAASEPVSTITRTGSQQRLVSAYLIKYYREGGQWQGCGEPMHTVPTKARMGLVEVVQVAPDIIAPDLRARAKAVADFLHEHLPEQFPEPADMVLLGGYVLADITLRMLVPRELARAQGFDDSYILERGLFETAPGSGQYEWKPITKTDQVRLIGNSVCPDMAAAEVANDLADVVALYAREAIAA